ncbi:MAG TPA: hypothetical protein VF037_01765 [Gemmatimonadales bacterium]
MNRILRGAVVLAASALFVGCNTEPEPFEGGDPDHIVANPGQVFVELGDSTEILVRLVDQQGTALNEPITFSGIESGISLSIDSLFRPVFGPDGVLIANPNNTELRIYVKGTGLAATSFTIESAGITETVPVTVLPTSLEATFSNLTPEIGEVVTITAPEGFIFNQNSAVSMAVGGTPVVVSVAPDGTTLSFIPKPKSSGAISVTNITPTYAPTLTVPLTLTEEITLGTTSPFSSDDPGAAPALAVPALNETIEFSDIQYADNQFISVTTTAPDQTLDITVNWTGSADVDFFFCNTDLTGCGSAALGGAGAATSAHPEHLVVTFANPGTYLLVTNLYSGTADYYDYTISQVLPED